MIARYDLREDANGWTVFDIWTGQPAVVHGVPLTSIEVQNADEVAELLTRLADEGDRVVRQ